MNPTPTETGPAAGVSRPPLGRRRRLGAALAVAAVLALAASTYPAGTAGGLEQQGLRVEEDQTIEQSYGPIPGQNPVPILPEYRLIRPEDCQRAAHCDVVPLEIVVPATLEDADEFFVEVELSWEADRIPEGPASPAPGEEGPLFGETVLNDLDLYIWNDPEEEQPVAAAASAEVPESLRMYRPTKGRYQIVVLNYLGPNRGYTLKVTYAPERIVPPFELLEPGFDPFPVEEEFPPPPVDLSGPEADVPDLSADPVPDPAPAPRPVTGPAAPPVDLGPVAAEPDPDFAFDIGDFDTELAAPVSDVLRERRARAVGPAEPASATSLVFWLVVVPLALVAAAGFWLARRRSTILRLS